MQTGTLLNLKSATPIHIILLSLVMPNLLIRDLDPEVLRRLKLRAKRHGRSLHSEIKEILKNNAPLSIEEARAKLAGIRAQLGGRKFSDSTDLVREDRDR